MDFESINKKFEEKFQKYLSKKELTSIISITLNDISMKKKILTIIGLSIFTSTALISFAGEPLAKGPIAGWHYSDILKDGNSLYGENYNSFL